MLQEPQETVDTPKKGVGQTILNILKFIGFILLSMAPTIVMSFLFILTQLPEILKSIFACMVIVIIITLIYFFWSKYYKYSGERIKKMGWRDIGFAFLFFLVASVISMVDTWLSGGRTTVNDEALMSVLSGINHSVAVYDIVCAIYSYFWSYYRRIGVQGYWYKSFLFKQEVLASVSDHIHYFWIDAYAK